MRSHYEGLVARAREQAEAACAKATRGAKRYERVSRDLAQCRADLDAAEARANSLRDALTDCAVEYASHIGNGDSDDGAGPQEVVPVSGRPGSRVRLALPPRSPVASARR